MNLITPAEHPFAHFVRILGKGKRARTCQIQGRHMRNAYIAQSHARRQMYLCLYR